MLTPKMADVSMRCSPPYVLLFWATFVGALGLLLSLYMVPSGFSWGP